MSSATDPAVAPAGLLARARGASRTGGPRRGAWADFLPQIPREHGAWVMLAAALVAGFAGARSIRPFPAALMGTAAVLAFFAQDALRRSVRTGAGVADLRGGIALGALACVVGGTLFFFCEPWSLLLLAGVGGLFCLVELAFASRYGALGVRQPLAAQLLGVAGLALAVPGAFLAAEGELRPPALLAGGACAAFFSSSVFYVRFLLECRHPERNSFVAARRAGWVYHGALLGLFAAIAALSSGQGVLWMLMFLPALVRAFHDLAAPPAATPPLRRVGLREAAYALWFALFLPLALR